MDYKDTLLLPNTKFNMRGNLPENEPKRYKKWNDEKIYELMKKNRLNASSNFTLHDGPPYANGNIHIGHALNKILKDIIVKYHYFDGKSVRFTVGWDCHGLPIEQQVEKKLGKEKKDTLPKTKIRELCRNHAMNFINIQKEEFKSLGVIGDFENPYKTMDFKFEANIYKQLCNVAKNGMLIQRKKPVYWSWAAKSALAEAEVEYEDKISPSIFVAFELSSDAKKELNLDKGAIIIWTTTPWTIPANSGISLHLDEIYVLTYDGFIVAEKLYDKLIELEVIKGDIINRFDAKVFEEKLAINPLNGRNSKIVLGEHVTMDSGSGAVHTAPGHGEDDYRIGLKYDLDVIMPVDDSGCYDESVIGLKLLPNAEEFVGVNVFDANDKICELLGKSLLKRTNLKHSYPHCWRTHKPVIFRATKQWFILMDEELRNLTVRQKALTEIKSVRFYPEWGRNRLNAMIENRPDWCISRQRDWGVPIAFFRNKLNDEIIFDEDVLEHLYSVFSGEGCDAWWSKSVEELLPKNSKYNPENLEKVMDILDVWFDSGSTWGCVLQSGEYDAGESVADLYLEGSDQHRGWFQSSLLVSVVNQNKAPYKAILTHGFTVDEHGEKMSKSKGNVVVPQDVLKSYGSEILRLWVAMSDYQSDLKISDNILKQISEQYRKIRNTLRFLLANIDDLDCLVSADKFSAVDIWILDTAKKLFDEADIHFKNYEFSKVFNMLNGFLVNELSGIYLDLCKDRLYCDKIDDTRRRASQSAMVYILEGILKLIAPVLTYTADEVLENAPKLVKKEFSSIFDFTSTCIPELNINFDEELLVVAKELFNEQIDKFKKDKLIKSTLDLAITIDSDINVSFEELEDWFIVSEVSKEYYSKELFSFEIKGVKFSVLLANKNKCPRCWKLKAVDENGCCDRCKRVLNG